MIPKTNPTVIRGHKGADQDFLGGGWWWVVRGMDCLLKRRLGFQGQNFGNFTTVRECEFDLFLQGKNCPGPLLPL